MSLQCILVGAQIFREVIILFIVICTMSNNEDEQYKAYIEDSRIPCRYGVKCYQKNPVHLSKYKHPPKKDAPNTVKRRANSTNKKRKNIRITKDDDDEAPSTPQKKIPRTSPVPCVKDSPSPAASNVTNHDTDIEISNESSEEITNQNKAQESSELSVIDLLGDCSIDTGNNVLSKADAKMVISQLFLLEMPEDFYHLYELCKSISESNPFDAFKDVQIKLVGPYDVFQEKFLHSKVNSKEKLLTHWRYYYDPPEFQTVLKGNDSNGLHFGYWRDNPSEMPVFVAINEANDNNLIKPVTENIFGALLSHIEDEIRSANPFKKAYISRLQRQIKNYVKENDIALETKPNPIYKRCSTIVARTFHKAGIAVPFDRKTKLGYRELAITNDELQKILTQIDAAKSADERKAPMSRLEEVVRLATIAADECDIGTPLELAHDLFSSGVKHVQLIALQMFRIAYTFLRRPQFLKIAEAHLEDRKKGSNLSAL